MPAITDPYTHPMRVARLPPHGQAVDLSPDAAARGRIAEALGLLGLDAVRLTGELRPAPGDAWAFTGRITASAIQPCGITLAPVPASVDEVLRREWSPHAGGPAAGPPGESEMGDDETEPLGAEIDLGAVLTEALALALPPFPRAPGASLLPEGEAPEAAGANGTRRPFAGLDALLRKD